MTSGILVTAVTASSWSARGVAADLIKAEQRGLLAFMSPRAVMTRRQLRSAS